MKIYRNTESVPQEPGPGRSLAIGIFDGVHLGHQALVNGAIRWAQQDKLRSAILTFEPHPAKVLAPKYAPKMLEPLSRRLERFEALGLDEVFIQPFNMEFAQMSPQDFVQNVLVEQLQVRHLTVGEGFVFGSKQSGDVELLSKMGQTLGFSAHPVGHIRQTGMVTSSSKIREFIVAGKIEGATLLLGRPPELFGPVVPGAGRGTGLGFGTANVRCENELLPATGVYAVKVRTNSGNFEAVLNVGYTPTFGGETEIKVEAHLLEYSGDELYNETIFLELIAYLRPERRFDGPESLKLQIGKDIDAARAAFAALQN
jgi:riboflavin kinase/FMN adenylyltransferase